MSGPLSGAPSLLCGSQGGGTSPIALSPGGWGSRYADQLTARALFLGCGTHVKYLGRVHECWHANLLGAHTMSGPQSGAAGLLSGSQGGGASRW